MTRAAVVTSAAVAAAGAGIAVVAGAPAAGPARTTVGVLTGVTGRVTAQHAGTKSGVVVRSGARVRLGDVLTLGPRASGRVVFRAAAAKATADLFALRLAAEPPETKHMTVHPGVAQVGPRFAFAAAGKQIATAAGRGLDAPTRLSAARPAGAGRVRFTFTAPATRRATFACRVGGGPFRACHSPRTLATDGGQHTFAVRTTSVLDFSGPTATRRFGP